MFYLRTGANGTCKTLFTLRDVRDLQLATGRPVRYNKNFAAKPILRDEFGWEVIEDFTQWEKEPKGTIFLIDEAYKDLPVRPNGQKPPKHIERLAEHRSMGHDFFFLALHPKQIDAWLRDTIAAPGWHQHLKRVAGASNLTRVLQWEAVNINCARDGSGKTAQIQNRLQPKECYAWYDSAFIHTGKVRIPKQVWYFIGGLFVAALLMFFAYKALMSTFNKKAPEPSPAAAGQVVTAGAPGAPGGRSERVLTQTEYVSSYTPRIPGLMHTSPAYDGITAPKRAPLPAACIESKSKGCKCFTQDATPYPTEPDICHQIATGGIFLAFVGGESASEPKKAPAASGAPSSPMQSVAVDGSRMVSMEARPVTPPLVAVSTVSRDAEVMAFMAKRRQIAP